MSTRALLAKLHGSTAAGVPRWAAITAYVTTLTVLPASVWRIAGFVFQAPLMVPSDTPPEGHGPVLFQDGPVYIVALTVVSEVLALLALGLVSRWGEIWPRWIPGLGGRPVPVAAAVIPAGLGAAALMVFPYALVMMASGRMLDGTPATGGLITHGWQTVAFWISYVPLAAWGPLLAVLTVHYYRRRRGAPALAA
ncbi:hypothetical protein OOK31_07790 [Streptomyces sp. NBC_00249]|uniref:hypothetical protein n=1 Tax=Streptomyces sp. NBC_00249 TaxID=2975690 RepID=UPI00224FDAC0|nr:hypothetical protein [Streptomyces sp. NBC_00249]MCX5193793.1 hypothetical protein [Streptomyces sp. NBC_00249]